MMHVERALRRARRSARRGDRGDVAVDRVGEVIRLIDLAEWLEESAAASPRWPQT